MTTAEDAFLTLLHIAEPDTVGPGGEVREGLVDTPKRAAKAWAELTRGYAMNPEDVLCTAFDGEGYNELLLQRNIPFTSLCEHHLLPFTGVAHLGYVTNGRVAGLSKLVRLVVDVYAPRLQMQERMTVEIANAMDAHLDPKGVIVVIQGMHSCIACRGVRVAGSDTITSALRGVLYDKPEARAEAYQLIHMGRL